MPDRSINLSIPDKLAMLFSCHWFIVFSCLRVVCIQVQNKPLNHWKMIPPFVFQYYSWTLKPYQNELNYFYKKIVDTVHSSMSFFAYIKLCEDLLRSTKSVRIVLDLSTIPAIHPYFSKAVGFTEFDEGSWNLVAQPHSSTCLAFLFIFFELTPLFYKGSP